MNQERVRTLIVIGWLAGMCAFAAAIILSWTYNPARAYGLGGAVGGTIYLFLGWLLVTDRWGSRAAMEDIQKAARTERRNPPYPERLGLLLLVIGCLAYLFVVVILITG